MKTILVLTEGRFLNGCIRINVDWPEKTLPEKGCVLDWYMLLNMVDWKNVSKDEILAAVKDKDTRNEWNYNYVMIHDMTDGIHTKAMKSMMQTYFSTMAKIIQVKADGCDVPEIWLGPSVGGGICRQAAVDGSKGTWKCSCAELRVLYIAAAVLVFMAAILLLQCRHYPADGINLVIFIIMPAVLGLTALIVTVVAEIIRKSRT